MAAVPASSSSETKEMPPSIPKLTCCRFTRRLNDIPGWWQDDTPALAGGAGHGTETRDSSGAVSTAWEGTHAARKDMQTPTASANDARLRVDHISKMPSELLGTVFKNIGNLKTCARSRAVSKLFRGVIDYHQDQLARPIIRHEQKRLKAEVDDLDIRDKEFIPALADFDRCTCTCTFGPLHMGYVYSSTLLKVFADRWMASYSHKYPRFGVRTTFKSMLKMQRFFEEYAPDRILSYEEMLLHLEEGGRIESRNDIINGTSNLTADDLQWLAEVRYIQEERPFGKATRTDLYLPKAGEVFTSCAVKEALASREMESDFKKFQLPNLPDERAITSGLRLAYRTQDNGLARACHRSRGKPDLLLVATLLESTYV